MLKSEKEIELEKEFNNYLSEILKSVPKEISISTSKNKGLAASILNKFHLFKAQQNPELSQVWMVQRKNISFTLCSVTIDSTLAIRGQYSSIIETQTHIFFYGFCKTGTSFGESLIRPETIQDKITEMFQKSEIDFTSNKQFSSKYFCLTKDEKIFRAAMSPEIMSLLENHPRLQLEFNNEWCLFRTEKSIIDKKSNSELIEFGIALSQTLNANHSR